MALQWRLRVVYSCALPLSGASIPIPGGRSLSPVKNRGETFFSWWGFLLRYMIVYNATVQSPINNHYLLWCSFYLLPSRHICLVIHWNLQLFWICYTFKTVKLLCSVLAIMICSNVYCEAKKTAPFYFCNNFVKYCYWKNYWCAYTLIKLEQNDVKLVNLL